MHKTDILIVGSGIAGLISAIKAKLSGANVAIAAKGIATKSNSVMAQGGINAALGNIDADSIELHIKDTLKSAHNLADEKMVSKLCRGGIEAIEFLEKLGVPFSRIEGADTPLKSIAQRALGGASAKRACYAQDYTGLKIVHTLLDSAINLNIPIFEGLFLLKLLKNSQNEVCGGLFFNFDSGEIEPIYAGKTVIATGGFGAIYSKNTNSATSTGDGVAAIVRAGGELSNMEFVQFHPTTLKGSNILISESARGEGGYLINGKGKRFIDELSTRDIISKAIFEQLQSGERVFLDLRHIGKEKLERLMPQELKLIKQYAATDACKESVEIEPAVHYTMGGASVNENFEVKGLKGCWCIGEAANANVHGANRLGGNSLLEAASFGLLAADEVLNAAPSKIEEQKINYSLPIEKGSDNFKIYKAKNRLGKLLFDKAGIVRDEKNLLQALKEIKELNIQNLKIDDAPKHSTLLIELLELQNASLLADAIVKSALWRKETRGAHIRSDYPQESREFERDSKIEIYDII